jgi:hypothetical protein
MRNRKDIITSMCYTMRHDYGLSRPVDSPFPLTSGLTDQEREALWNQMAQMFDNNIAPYMEFREWVNYSDLPLYKKLHEDIKNICKNKIIADVACGDGANTLGLPSNPKLIKLCDIRNYVNEDYKKNYKDDQVTFETIDITIEKDLKRFLNDCEIIVYCGHLYHTNCHEQILRNFTESNAKYLFIESKVTDIAIGEDPVPRIEQKAEYTTNRHNVYHLYEQKVDIGRPNLAWTIQKLEEYGWNIFRKVSRTNNTNNSYQYYVYATRGLKNEM